MKQIKLVHIITDLDRGGAEAMLVNQLAFTDRERFRPFVISLMDHGVHGAAIEKMGVPVFSLGMSQGRPRFGSFRRLIGLLKMIRPDVIQASMYHANLAALLAGFVACRKTPVFWCVQSSFHSFGAEKPLTAAVIRLSGLLSKRTAGVVYVSAVSRVQHERLGFSQERGVVIPNAVDTGLFAPDARARFSVREELGLKPETLLIGLMARHHPQKDHPGFLKAASLLLRDYPYAHFLLAGAGVDSNNAELAELIKGHGIGDRLHLLGARTDAPRITAALDMATSSSSYGEALSLAIAEAMAAEVPCVVTDVGDSKMLVGDTGLVVAPSKPEALASAWANLIDMGPDRRRALGEKARRRVEAHYRIEPIMAQYEELYRAGGC